MPLCSSVSNRNKTNYSGELEICSIILKGKTVKQSCSIFIIIEPCHEKKRLGGFANRLDSNIFVVRIWNKTLFSHGLAQLFYSMLSTNV